MLETHKIDLRIRKVIGSSLNLTINEIVTASRIPETVVRDHIRGLVKLGVVRQTADTRDGRAVLAYAVNNTLKRE